MRRRPASFLLFPCLAALAAQPALAEPGSAELSFRRDVRPILSDKCFSCHGPDEKTREADLRLDTPEGARADLGGYAAIVPGNLEKSELIARILTDEKADLMPPEKFHKPLTAAEIDILKRWVAAGAEYESHWAYTPLTRPTTPGADDQAFVKNDIDRFLLAEQQKQGLKPAPEADRITLARRLYLDITGLPPTPEQVAAFAKNTSPTAYEDLVDELLRSKHFGERMAIFWLDLVRYADTIGYHSDNHMEVSAYRDYVIEAFNDNLSYDRFAIDQLAGDLLPEPTLKQRIASGYNRLLQTTEEGGAQPKEYMAIYAADRVRNVSEVWLGSTMGCAQCHDHKYDPFTMKDFYSMAAFFSDIDENAVGKRQPNLKLPTPEEEAEMADLKTRLAENTLPKVLARDAALAGRVADAQKQWEAGQLAAIGAGAGAWRVVKPEGLKSAGGQELKPQPDGSVLAGGAKNPDQDTYTAVLKGSGKITGLRLEALPHETLTKKSLSRGNGNFVLNQVGVTASGKPVPIAKAAADFEQDGFPVAGLIDTDPQTGWAGNGHNEAEARTAVLTFAQPVDLGEAGALTIELKYLSQHARHHIGRFRLSLTEAPAPAVVPGADVPLDLIDALSLAPEKRSPQQIQAISTHYQTIAPALEPQRKDLAAWQKRLEDIDKSLRTMLVAASLKEPRMTRLLPRGNWLDESGAAVEPALPDFLPRDAIDGRRANRLDLARWIVSPGNPLTSRAFMNRLWKLFYGRGLSRDLNDLGGQGQPPSHPELLDWLAVEFRDGGWDMKQMVRLLVTSGAYRQSSTTTPATREKDPNNLWLARQGRWRLEAELVRDTALGISGLLVTDIGGKSVKPYQPAKYWQHLNFPQREWENSKGAELYRRGLYTFWCRSFPHPAMTAFDAPSREECTAERSRSNTPQQALVLLNDPVYVEASRVFAANTSRQPADDAGKLDWAWRHATGRAPTDAERDILTRLLQSQLARYTADPESAKLLLATGDSPAPADLDPATLAAWTQVARAILNAYETTSRF
jgi:hypothetical protein